MGFIVSILWFLLKLAFTGLFWMVVVALCGLWLIAYLAGKVGVGPMSDAYRNR